MSAVLEAYLTDGSRIVDLQEWPSRPDWRRILAHQDDGTYEWGAPTTDGGPRLIRLPITVRGDTRAELDAAIREVQLMVDAARDLRGDGVRGVTFVFQAPDADVPTVFDVTGGTFDTNPTSDLYLVHRMLVAASLTLEVEPTARGEETDVVSAATLYPSTGLTHRFLHHTGGTVFSGNLAWLPEGSLWQSDSFTIAPTLRTPTTGDALYWINTDGPFGELITRITLAQSGITFGAYQYWNGSAWTTLAPSRDDFNISGPFTATGYGKVAWTPPSDWATTTVNTVTGHAVRLVVSSVASPTPPQFSDMFSTLRGRAEVDESAVRGDVAARTKLQLTNATSTPLAGLEVGCRGSRLADVPPPLVLPWAGADLQVGASTVSAAVATDADTLGGQRVTLSTGISLVDRAQRFSGGAYASAAVTAGDKIDALGSGSFFIEVPVDLSLLTNDATMLVSRWDSNTANRVFWFGVDQRRVKCIVYNSGGTRKTAIGATTLPASGWAMLSFEFRADRQRLYVHVDSDPDGSVSVQKPTLRTGLGTALRLVRSVGSLAGDFDNSAAEYASPDISLSWVWIEGRRLDDVFGVDHYPMPKAKRTTEGYAGGSATKLYLELDDNTASTTLLDSSASPKNLARSTGNSSANTIGGMLQPGAGTAAALVLSMHLPQSLGREHGGRYRIFLRARPAATLTALDHLTFSLQFGPGDTALAYQAAGLRFPALASPSGAYYWLDAGPVTFAQAGLADYRSGQAARSWLRADLFMTYNQTLLPAAHVDCLVLVPIDAGFAEYRSFGAGPYVSANALAQGESYLLDGTGPAATAFQTDTAGVPDRNAYAAMPPSPLRLRAGVRHWLSAIPLRGAGTDVGYILSAPSDRLTATLTSQARWAGVAS